MSLLVCTYARGNEAALYGSVLHQPILFPRPTVGAPGAASESPWLWVCLCVAGDAMGLVRGSTESSEPSFPAEGTGIHYFPLV